MGNGEHGQGHPLVAQVLGGVNRHVMRGQEFNYPFTAGPATGLTLRVRFPEVKLHWIGI